VPLWKTAHMRFTLGYNNSMLECELEISPWKNCPSSCDTCIRRGVRGYACINTLIFTDELLEAEHLVRACINCGVDGIVVQDIGLAILIRKISPDVPIHASTQMTITHSDGIKFASELGCNLVVLARECSIAHIQEIPKNSQNRRDLNAAAGICSWRTLCIIFWTVPYERIIWRSVS